MEAMKTQVTPTMTAALNYAAHGLPVLPLHGKIPLGALVPNGSKDATTDKSVITAWWAEYPHADVGIATGHDNFFVIDIDGDEGRASFDALRKQLGDIATVCVKTPSGGFHLYLRAPDGVEIRNKQSQKEGWSKIDVRGTGGYVVAPPSMGGRYSVVDNGVTQIALCPPAWIDALTTTTLKASLAGARTGARVSEGGRNNALIAEVGRWIEAGYSHATTREMVPAFMRNEFDSPLDEKEWMTLVDKAYDRWQGGASPGDKIESRKDADDVLVDIVDRCRETPSTAHAEATIDALIILEETDNPRYIDLSSAIVKTKAINKTTLVKLVKQRKNAKKVEKGLAQIVDIDDAPTGFKIPHGYKNGEGGLYFIGDDGPEETLSVPLYVTKRLRTVVEKEEKLELRYKRDGEWHSIIADRSQATFTDGLKLLSDRGLPVTGENAMKVVKFITQFETLNRDVIPLEQTVTKAGWIGTSLFYPGHAGDISYTPEYGTLATEAAFACSGTLEAWDEVIAPLCQSHPLARLQIAASFAAPLLQVVGHRNFVVHLHGRSGSGKSATLFAAMSIWGAPSALVGNFNTTAVGLEHRLSMSNGLPVALNERQHANKGVDQLVYMAGEGAGRTRGAKAGGLRSMQTWQMILLTNGEEPLVSEHAPEGARTRAIEIEGEPIDDDALASSLYDLTATNHGHAGRVYMGDVLKRLGNGPASIKSDYDYWHGWIKEVGEDKIPAHLSALAIIALADVYRQVDVSGMKDDKARESTAAWMLKMIHKVPSKGEASEARREHDFVLDLVAKNKSRFTVETALGEPGSYFEGAEHWGILTDDFVFMNPLIFREKLSESGLRPVAAKRRLAELGILKTEPTNTGGSDRYIRRIKKGRWVVLALTEKGIKSHV